jgi:hypothetical protein
LAALRQAGTVDAARLRVVLRAPGDIAATSALVAQFDVGDLVEVLPPVPYREALQEMLAADGLLVFQGTPFNTQIPAKIYEYFRARKPILGLVDTAGETARVLGAAGFASVAHIDRKEEIMPVLARFIDEIRNGSAYRATDELIQASSRVYRARQLAEVFDRAVQQAA